jgi:sugar-specific transcriptional regulator TrmB
VDLYLRILSGAETSPPPSPARDQLISVGLVAPDPGRPDRMQALDVDAAVRQWQASLVQVAVGMLSEAQSVPAQLSGMASAYRAAHPGRSLTPGVEVVTGFRAINERLETLVNGCTRELLTAQPTGPRPADLLAVSYQRDLGVLKRGATMRTIYLPSARADGPTARWALTMTERGAQIRTGRTFGRAIVVDRRVAVVPVLEPWSSTEVAPDRAAVVTDEILVALVCGSFERDWTHSEPWGGEQEPELLPVHVGILSCLARGMEQDGIAAQLEVSRRTVTSRLAELKTMVGAATVPQLLYWWAKRELQR